jgi:hypothetical protein
MSTKGCPETGCTEPLTTREFDFDPEPSTDRPTPAELRQQYEEGECPDYLDGEDAPELIERASAEVEHHCTVHGIVGRE